MNVDGVAAIVSGGASGLGAATARRLSEEGARVVVLDLDPAGEEVAAEIGGLYVPADVTDAASVVGAVDAAVEMGPLRILVNCAGILAAQRTVARDGTYENAHDLDRFAKVVGVNLVGTFNCVRLAASAMSRQEPDTAGERGAIVNTASIAAFEGQEGQVSYAASKGGIVAMTMPLARDLAAVGIRVNTVAPGLIDTPIYGSGAGAEELKRRLLDDVVFPRRFGQGGEFASLVVELIRNAYMNAEIVRLDGGARLSPTT
jgi:NAD(P)-dependent dehydrogenase (short-subunit alcohol dehydrogenase family)